MEKATSVIAAFNAGKLPTTQQFNAFIDLFDKYVGHETGTLSAQGRLLSSDLRDILDAYKSLLNNKNADNILQESLFHLSQAQQLSPERVFQQTTHGDIQTIHRSLQTLLSKLWSSFTSQSTSQLLIDDLFSLIRTSLADAAEIVEGKAGKAKDSLRQVEEQVQQGKRDVLGRDKESLEAERSDPKVAWEHGMDRVKVAGTTAISTVQSAEEKTEQGRQKLESKLKREYHSIWERAQNDSEYRQALDTLFSLLQTRLHKTLDTASSSDLSSLFDDPTPDQHIYKALNLLRLFFERFLGGNNNGSLDPLLNHLRSTLSTILRDPQLNAWFDDFFAFARKNLASQQPSSESEAERKDLKARWKKLMGSDSSDDHHQWRDQMHQVRAELIKLEQAICEDGDLKRLKEAQEKLARDLKNRLREAVVGEEEVKEGVEKAIEEATWFWQDLFKVYLPRGLNMLESVPIPRTEYKDQDIEFVLENLDISKLNILPSHVYIRNITDVDIQTTTAGPSSSSKSQLGTLTRIQLQAVQLDLKDVSFWYKDKHAIVTPTSELTGLLTLTLPPQGLSLDLQIRLIPSSLAQGSSNNRTTLKKYHVIERASVEISDEVEISVKESNHPLWVGVFQPWVRRRIKEALERTLSVQLRAWVDWVDGLAYDVGMRKEVFEDVGMTDGPAFVAALWSELGKMERSGREKGVEIGIEPTGTGIVVEEKVVVPETTKTKKGGGGGGGFEYETGKEKVKERVLAVGVEPQILDGSKRGPLGIASQPLVKKVEEEIKERVQGEQPIMIGMEEERAKGIEGFKKAVKRKEREEKDKKLDGWKSDAFDF